MAATRIEIFNALAQKTGFEVIDSSLKESRRQLRFLGRSKIDRWPAFLPVLQRLLRTSNDHEVNGGIPWTCDISKQYLVKPPYDRVFYSWRFIFQAEELTQHYGAIAQLIMTAPAPARTEVTSIRLPGAKPGQVRGGVDETGKGSSAAGTLPKILQRRP